MNARFARATLLLAVLAATAHADRGADMIPTVANSDYYVTLRPRGDSGIFSVRDRLKPGLQELSPRVGKSVRNVLRRGFQKKYKKELPYLTCLVEILAAGGDAGISILAKQFKGEGKRPELRKVIAEELGKCGDDRALSSLLKMTHDKEPDVAAAAVTACAPYAKVPEKRRKAAVKALIEHYRKTGDRAAGKDRDAPPMRMYLALRGPMNATLKAFTGADGLESPDAWKAWFAENSTKKWE